MILVALVSLDLKVTVRFGGTIYRQLKIVTAGSVLRVLPGQRKDPLKGVMVNNIR